MVLRSGRKAGGVNEKNRQSGVGKWEVRVAEGEGQQEGRSALKGKPEQIKIKEI